LDPAHQVGEGGIFDQVVDAVAMGSGHQLYPPLGNGTRGQSFQFSADLVDNYHFGHVVFHCLDHHLVLQLWAGHLHPSGPTNTRMGHVSIAGNLVGSVDNNHSFAQLIRQHTGNLPQGRGFAHPRSAQQQHRAPLFHQVADHADHADNAATHPTGKADDRALAVADGTDPVQGRGNACAVVTAELSNPADHLIQVGPGDHVLGKVIGKAGEAGFGAATQIQHHLHQPIQVGMLF
jgi:hypothetical protein